MTSTNSSLRPAWQSRGNQGGGRGFQPPPQVASERINNNNSTSNSASTNNNNNANSAGGSGGGKKHNNTNSISSSSSNNNNNKNDHHHNNSSTSNSNQHHNQHHSNRNSHESYANDSGADSNRRERHSSNFNKFSALDDDDDIVDSGSGTNSNSNNNNNSTGNGGNSNKVTRSEAMRGGVVGGNSGTTSNISKSTVAKNISSGRPTRSLADLVASAPGPTTRERSSSGSFAAAAASGGGTGSGVGIGGSTSTRYGMSGRNVSTDRTGTTAASTSTSVDHSAVKVTKYTRERLMALRPNPISNELSELLINSVTPEVRAAILSDVPQDPVCWDDFDGEQIWAAAGPSVRRATGASGAGPSGSKLASGGSGAIERSTSTGIPSEDASNARRGISSSTSGIAHPTSSGIPRSGSRGLSSANASSGGGTGTGDGFGRWQRGVALPPPDSNSNSRKSTGGTGGRNDREAEDPSELWDDPGSAMDGAAADFSAFGMSLSTPKFDGSSVSNSNINEPFDFEKMTEATKRFQEELHGTSSSPKGVTPSVKIASSDADDNDADDSVTSVRGIRVDPKRPLASDGTTIRSGSGDNVNVFEDFDDPAASTVVIDGDDAIAALSGTVSSDNDFDSRKQNKKGQPTSTTIRSIDEDPDASSRLMALIGVKKEDATTMNNADPIMSSLMAQPSSVAGAVESSKLSTSGWGASDPILNMAPNANDSSGAGATLMGLSLNPWGGSSLLSGGSAEPTDQMHGIDFQARLRAAEINQQQQHQLNSRDEDAQRRLMAQQQQQQEEVAKQQERARLQQFQQRQQQATPPSGVVQSQVETVLMERISAILENSWGRSDLVSILSTLHAEDSRVIPLLSTVDALRALLHRNSQRVGVRQDASLRAEMASLLITNAQWQQKQQQTAAATAAAAQQQQQQQQQRLRAQQEELQRREQQQRRLEEQQAQAAQAAVAAARAQQQQQQSASIISDAPWFYSDPQKNIQGPFRGEEMRQWLEAGYFKGDLPISQQPRGPFRPLSAIFQDLSGAFVVPNNPALIDNTNIRAMAEERARMEPHAMADQLQQQQLQAAAMAANAESDRLDTERRTKEVERRAREAAVERQRLLVERERRSIDAAAAGDQSESSATGNESSAQLKMMLGLNAQFGGGQGGDVQSTNNSASDLSTGLGVSTSAGSTGAEAPTTIAQKNDKKSSKNTNKATASSTDTVLSPSGSSTTLATPAASVWGGAAAAKVTTKKSMSEIQKEEARAAAIAASRNEKNQSGGGGGSGWANVAAARGGSNAWAGGAAAQKPAIVLTKVAGPAPLASPPVRVGGANATLGRAVSVGTGNPVKTTAVQRSVSGGTSGVSATTTSPNTDEFGAKMTPQLEKWCKDQMQKLNGKDDLTLVSFCMTLSDPVEIRQYLTTYLGSSSQVNNFATEFINRTIVPTKEKTDEWASTVNVKKGKKKKPVAK